MPIPVLETERLRLRPFDLSDAPIVQALAGAAEVAVPTLNVPHPYPDGAAELWIRGLSEHAEAGDVSAWAISDRTDGRLLGAISIAVNRRHQRGMIGYWLGVPFWNQGYMTEAVKAVVGRAFAALHLHRVEAHILPRNNASLRVAEKAGLRYEGTFRGYILQGNVFEDVAIYGRAHDQGDGSGSSHTRQSRSNRTRE